MNNSEMNLGVSRKKGTGTRDWKEGDIDSNTRSRALEEYRPAEGKTQRQRR